MTAKILCVDDEAEIRQDVVEELQDAGYQTIEAGDGKAGLEAIVAQKPDLVLCDITMPVMDGHALLRELRDRHPEQADLPFIFLSALADRDHVIAGKKLGADDYLTKPLDFQLMLATVEARLQQIQRMEARKQEQLVKVYVAAQSKAVAPAASRSGVEAPVAEQRTSAPEEGPRKNTGKSESNRRIEALVAESGGRLVAGRVQVVGLGEVKEALGDRWLACASRVQELAEATVRRRLSKGDVLEISKTGEFLICFASLNQTEAAFKARAIAREVRERILGTEDIEIQIKDACDVSSEAHEVKVAPEELAEEEDVLGLVMGRLKKAASLAREAERKTMTQIVKTCNVVQLRASMAKGEAPIALADFDEVTRSSVQSLQRARPASDELAVEIDILRLGRCAELLCENALESQAILVVHLDFSSLDHRRLSDQYLQVCRSLIESAKSNLAFNIRNISKDYLPAKIVAAANMIRPYCRFVMAELNDLSLGNVDPIGLQSPILTCSYRNAEARLAKNPDSLKRLATDLKARKSRLLIYDVPRGEDTMRLLGMGADFVSSR